MTRRATVHRHPGQITIWHPIAGAVCPGDTEMMEMEVTRAGLWAIAATGRRVHLGEGLPPLYVQIAEVAPCHDD